MSTASKTKTCRAVRLFCLSTWLKGVEDASAYVGSLPEREIASFLEKPDDPEVVKLAHQDRGWDAAGVEALARMEHPDVKFLEAQAVGMMGLVDLAEGDPPPDEERWITFQGQKPQRMAGIIGELFKILTAKRYKILYWSTDDASRKLSCLEKEVAPYLSVYLHDEFPLAEPVAAALRPECIRSHRSWTANVVPFAHPFVEDAEDVIIFWGSKNGLTLERHEQIAFLEKKFGAAFRAICDHSLPFEQRDSFARYKAHLCPEGRHFKTFTMRETSTDRPFLAGCLGQVPVVEDSHWGGRMLTLRREGLIQHYAHGDLDAMARACENALNTPTEQRRKIYDHFNRHETVGNIAAPLIAQAG